MPPPVPAPEMLPRRRRLALLGGYGMASGALALAISIGVTRLMVGPHGGGRATAVLLAVTLALGAACAVAGGPVVVMLEDRLRRRHGER